MRLTTLSIGTHSLISKRRLFGISWLDVLDNARDETVAVFRRTDRENPNFSRTDGESALINRTKKENADFAT